MVPGLSLVDGQPSDAVGLGERGLQFGDGLFETLPIVNGRPCHWAAHMRRLERGCDQLRLPRPNVRLLLDDARTLVGSRTDGVLKIYWTAGDSRRGYARPQPVSPRRILQIFDRSISPADRMWRVTWCLHRMGESRELAGIKHLNRFDQVIARDELRDTPCDEGLLRGQDDRVISGSMTNLFVQLGDRLLTPKLDRSGIRGVVRDLVLQCGLETGSPVVESTVSSQDLLDADAVYLSNSLVGIVDVGSIDQKRFDMPVPAHGAIDRARGLVHRPDRRWDTE